MSTKWDLGKAVEKLVDLNGVRQSKDTPEIRNDIEKQAEKIIIDVTNLIHELSHEAIHKLHDIGLAAQQLKSGARTIEPKNMTYLTDIIKAAEDRFKDLVVDLEKAA